MTPSTASSVVAAPAATETVAEQRPAKVDLHRWPLGWRDVPALLRRAPTPRGAVFIAVGELLTHALRQSVVQRSDERIERWLADHRAGWTRRRSSAPNWPSRHGGQDLRDRARRGDDARRVAALVGAADGRARARARGIGVHHHHVDRRPAASRRAAPRDLAGRLVVPLRHVAAAVVYGAVAVVVCWHTRRTLWRVLAFGIVTLIAAFAGFAQCTAACTTSPMSSPARSLGPPPS